MPRSTLVIFDHELRFLVVEGQALEVFGFDTETMIGNSISQLFTGEHRVKSEQVARTVLKGHELDFEYRFNDIVMRVQVYPLRQGGEIIAGVSIIEDITERKAAADHELELIVERQRIKVITDFITTAHHEFRTPLSVIESSLYIAERTEDEKRRMSAFERVRKQIQALSRLLEQLTLMAQLDASPKLQRESLNLNHVVRFAVAEVMPRASDRGIILETDLTDALSSIHGDYNSLVQVLNNLLDNALTYTPNEGCVTVRTRLFEGDICIDVIDNGVGIMPEDAPHIFERFYRNDKAHSTPGFGLGLPIAREIIRAHGGNLTVNSTPGNGATFTIQLPLTE
jgi:PAS domain S-box-containing protein